MAIFRYTSIKKMEPRPGVKYATTYYKQRRSELERLEQHVIQTARMIMETPVPEPVDLDRELRDFPRTNGQLNYSVSDLVADILTQIDQGKYRVKAGNDITIDSTTKITIVVGSSSIVLEPSKITIKSPAVEFVKG